MAIIADILRSGRAAISREEDWGSRDQPGRGNGCSLIALHNAWGDVHRGHFFLRKTWSLVYAEDALKKAIADDNVAAWNDSHTHAEVLAGWDRAIALAEEMERAR
jgi:hypothetical protein